MRCTARIMGARARTALIGVVTVAVLLGAGFVDPALGDQTVDDLPIPVALTPTNTVPGTVHVPSDDIPQPVLPDPPLRPAPGTVKAQVLAQAEAEIAAELAAVDDTLTSDVVEGTEVAPVVEPVSEELATDMSEQMADLRQVEPVTDESDDVDDDAPAPTASTSPSSPSREPVDEAIAAQDKESHRADDSEVGLAAGCAPVPGVPFQGSLTVQQMGLPVWNNRDGHYRVRVDNQGTQAWPAGSSVSYQLFDAAGNLLPGARPVTAIPQAVGANGGAVSFDATIAKLAPGTWLLAWDIHVQSAGWLTDRGVCSSNFQLTVANQPPTVTYTAPANRGTVTTQTPFLTVTGSDPDAWPSPTRLTYQFTICADAALTTSCTTSPWRPVGSWQAPPRSWGGTSYWAVAITDGNATTDARSATQSFTVVVPAPDDWRRVGNGLGLAEVSGVILPYGVFVHRAVDAALPGGGLPLSIERTFSSGALGTEGAFGKGWLSLFDARADYNARSGLLQVTYPDGRQENFGLDDQDRWVSRSDLGVANQVTSVSSDAIVVRQATGETLSYHTPTGRLLTVSVDGAGMWKLTYTDGLVSRISQEPSGRHLDVEWSAPQSGCDPGARPTRPYVTAISTGGLAEGPSRTWEYSYACDRLTTARDPRGGTTEYISIHSFFQAKSPAGRTLAQLIGISSWQNAPDDTHQERTVTVGEPGSYDRRIRLVRPVAGSEAWYRTTYNSYNGVTAMYCAVRELRNGAEHCFDAYDTLEFDVAGRLRIKARREDGAGAGRGNPRVWTYSPTTGQLTSVIDEQFNVMNLHYDGWGNLTASSTMRDAATQVTSTSHYRPTDHDPRGPARLTGSQVIPTQARSSVHGSEFAEQYSYDSGGRLLAHDGPTVPGHPDGEQRSYTYSSGSEAAVDGSGRAEPGRRMPSGLLRTETSAAGTTTYGYDALGEPVRVDEPGGASIGRVFDSLGYLVQETVNDTAIVDYHRDANGRVTREWRACVVDPITERTTSLVVDRQYDPDGLITEVTETATDCDSELATAPPRVTRYSYTAQGRLASVTDARGGVTRYAYSDLNPSQLEAITDPRGRTTQHYYDNRGRLYRISADVGLPGSTTRADTWSTRDVLGHLVGETDVLRRSTSYTYSDDGYELSATRSGVVIDGVRRAVPLWDRTYDGAGNILTETVGGWRTTAHTYDAMSRLVSSTLDPGGLNRTTSVERDAAGRTVATVLSDGSRQERRSQVLDASGFPVAEQIWLDPGTALTTTFTRDVWGNALHVTDPRGATLPATQADYTSGTAVDEIGRVVTYTGPPTTAEVPVTTSGPDAFTEPLAVVGRATERIGYNAFGDVTAVEDARGDLTTYVYDAGGALTEAHLPTYRDPDGQLVDAVIRYEYSRAGDLLRKTDARGGVTEYEYDISGHLVLERGPELADGTHPSTAFAYDAAGQLTSRTSASGVQTTFSYDALGRVVAETVAERSDPDDPRSPTVDYVTSFGYDAAGNLTSTTTPAGRTTRFEHNAAGEVVTVRHPGITNPTRFEYDAAGRVVRTVEPTGRSVRHVFDAAGRETRTEVTGSEGAVLTTSYAHDLAGNVLAVTDPRGTTTTYTVDASDQVTSIRQPTRPGDAITLELGHDRSGNLVRVRNGNGANTWTTYNAWGLPQSTVEPPTKRYPDVEDRRWSSTYDASGNRTVLAEPGGSTRTTTYDALDRAVTHRAVDASGQESLTTSSQLEYDLDGRPTRIELDDGHTVEEATWNDRGLVTATTSDRRTHSLFSYDADGLPATDRKITGDITYEWDEAGRLVRQDTATAPTVAFRNDYDLATGVLTQRHHPEGRTAWSYDQFGRTEAIVTHSPSGTVEQDVRYGYDANSNITSRTSLSDVQAGGEYTYDLADRLTRWSPRSPDGSLGPIYPRDYQWDDAGNRTAEWTNATERMWTYDERNQLVSTRYDDDYRNGTASIDVSPDGNVTAVGDRDLEYDLLNRLVRDGDVRYQYDSLGRLAQRDGARFEYPGWSADPDVVVDAHGDREQARWSPDGDLLATGGTYGTRVALTDTHGDLTAGLRTTGSTTTSRDAQVGYDPFGNRWTGSALPVETGPRQASVLGFQSDYTDPLTGTVAMGSRWYDPALGVFLTRDATALPATSAGALNRYSYGDANPVNHTDPTGRAAQSLLAPPITDTFTTWMKGVWDLPFDESMRRAAGEAVETVAETVVKKGALRVAARIATKFVPYVGWASLAADAFQVIDWISDYFAPPTVTPGPTTTPSPSPPPKQTVTPVTSRSASWTTTGTTWATESLSNTNGLRVITTTWLADHYQHTRTDWSNGDWQTNSAYLGRYAINSIQEVLGRVIDPSRVDQSHSTPVLSADQRISVTGQASPDGQCGLSGTIASCLVAGPTVATTCAAWDSPLRLCAPRGAVPGPPGATGTATGAGPVGSYAGPSAAPSAGQTPQTATGGMGGDAGRPPSSRTPRCEPDESASAQPRDSLGRFASGAGGESADTAAGRSAHDIYPLAVGSSGSYEFNTRLPGSLLRPDAWSRELRVVRELKPANPSAVARGWRQVNAYKAYLEEITGEPWTACVDEYES
jgi:RHS repeat-associated protein